MQKRPKRSQLRAGALLPAASLVTEGQAVAQRGWKRIAIRESARLEQRREWPAVAILAPVWATQMTWLASVGWTSEAGRGRPPG